MFHDVTLQFHNATLEFHNATLKSLPTCDVVHFMRVCSFYARLFILCEVHILTSVADERLFNSKPAVLLQAQTNMAASGYLQAHSTINGRGTLGGSEHSNTAEKFAKYRNTTIPCRNSMSY